MPRNWRDGERNLAVNDTRNADRDVFSGGRPSVLDRALQPGALGQLGSKLLGSDQRHLLSPGTAMNARAAVATSLGLLFVAASALAQGQKAPRLDDMALRAIINEECMTTNGTTDPVSKVENIVIPAVGRQIPARIYRPGGNGPHPVLIFLHGGAMLAGNLETHDNACRYLCHRASCTVVSVDYRLAPEHKFPAQVDDCYAATVWVAAHAKDLGVDVARLAVIGDSAGGMFTAAVCLMARDRKGPAIRFQVLVNPALNLARQRPVSDEGDRVVNRIIKESYLKDPKDALDPLASPLLAETFKGLPPALVVTAERDVWREDGEEYFRRLWKDGVKVNIYRQDGIGHLGPLWRALHPPRNCRSTSRLRL